MQRVIVDDLRYFPGVDATYHRTSQAALAWFEAYRATPVPVELWLDHDLGNGDDIRPLVLAIEEHLVRRGPLPITVRILTSNPVGRKWIQQALAPLAEV